MVTGLLLASLPMGSLLDSSALEECPIGLPMRSGPSLLPGYTPVRSPEVVPSGVSQFSLAYDAGESSWLSVVEGISLPETLRGAATRRKVEFAAGRVCAREAMGALGVVPETVGLNVDRSPRWPLGITGSITHAAQFASAAVATSTDVSAIGIDSEPVIDEIRARQVTAAVAWPIELAHARAAQLTRLEALTLVFSAKEALFKCLYPQVGRVFDFHDVRLTAVDGLARTFHVRLVRPLSPRLPAGTLLEGRFSLDERGIHTGIVLDASVSRKNHGLA